MQQEIGIIEFFQGRSESIQEGSRKIADETDGIGNDHFEIPREAQPATAGIKGGEEFVFHKDQALGEGIQER